MSEAAAQQWTVGEPWIVPMDAPSGDMIVVCTHPDGRARYLVIKRNRRWPHELNLGRMGRVQRLADYGISCERAAGAVVLHRLTESIATYDDGTVQRWQGSSPELWGPVDRLPLRGQEPDAKYWRMDAAVAPKFLNWMRKHGRGPEDSPPL